MKTFFARWTKFFRRYSDRWWAAPLIGLTAFADLFVIVIPTDGLLVSTVMLAPRRWIYTAVVVALGSSFGAVALAFVLRSHGLPFLLHLKPDIEQTHAWIWTVGLMDHWGDWALFGISLSPIMQHPAIALASFAGMSLARIFCLVFSARLIKYLFIAWIATHAPRFIGKLWGMQYELKELGFEDTPP
jgi:membrane protein YqaA with SNARE-associated domain